MLLPFPNYKGSPLQRGGSGSQRWSFNLTETNFDLILSELDTIAEVRVNGALILSAINAFRAYRVDLSNVAQIGKNQIDILFRSSAKTADALQAEQPFPVPNSKNCPIPNGNLLRKPACDFGWDWNIPLPDMLAYFLTLKPDMGHINGYGGTLLSTIIHGSENAPDRASRDHIGCARLALEEGVALPKRAIEFAGEPDMAAFLAGWGDKFPGQVVEEGVA